VWLRNFWYVAAFSKELEQRPVARTICGQELVLYRTSDGRPVALDDKCPHRGVPLSMGRVIDNTIRCTYHGMRIDADGQCVRIPCQDQIPAAARVRSYPLQERWGFAWIWLGAPEAADAALIPDVHWMEDPAWAACSGYTRAEANYQLFTDNLLDLSHESFLHEATIGNEAVAEAPVKTTVADGQVRVHREIANCEPPPFYVKATGFTGNINRWHTTIFQPPSYCLIENGSYPVEGDRSQALERRVIHLITPETETSSHYFWAVARPYRLDDAELTEFIRVQSANTFAEDEVMLEAQQRSLGALGGQAFPVALKTDAGPIQARRLVSQLLAQELARSPAAAATPA
jgi:phenylpropionate dioxygenase-like ring-hydroxylating dioxygenase large terminal subunit